MDYSENKLFSKKNIISYLLLAILIVAIPVGIRLVQQQQILKSRAAGEAPITFKSPSGTNVVDCSKGECVTTSSTIDIEVFSPLGAPASP